MSRRRTGTAMLTVILVVMPAVMLAMAGCRDGGGGEDGASAVGGREDAGQVEAYDEPGPLPRRFAPARGETRFGELLMLTDGGENAEAYFSWDSRRLVFQSTRPPFGCDQIMTLDLATAAVTQISSGRGRTTCAYYDLGDSSIVYASTHLSGEDCPPPPDMSAGYVWALYPGYDIFRVALRGGRPAGEPVRLTASGVYDAEATVSPADGRIVFTSLRDGDLDIYSMAPDGTDVRRLTDEIGYDGGPFYSPDGRLIVYRAHHPRTAEEIADYQALLARHQIRPSRLEIWVMNADGSDKRQVTDLGCASFAPFFHPSGRKIIFSSNHPTPRSREFELFLVDLDGGNLEQVTHSPEFDGFPMWAPDGETFVFCSNRHNRRSGETNVFVTTWRD